MGGNERHVVERERPLDESHLGPCSKQRIIRVRGTPGKRGPGWTISADAAAVAKASLACYLHREPQPSAGPDSPARTSRKRVHPSRARHRLIGDTPCTKLTLALAVLLLPAAAVAQIYQWKDASGKIHYSDQPPPATAKQERTVTPRLAPATAAVEGRAGARTGTVSIRTRKLRSSSDRSSKKKRKPSRKRTTRRRRSASATASWPRAI